MLKATSSMGLRSQQSHVPLYLQSDTILLGQGEDVVLANSAVLLNLLSVLD
jgi:hypothetical protein